MRRPKPKSVQQEPDVQVTVQLEGIRDTALAADLCRRILRAQARAAAKRAAQRQEQHDDAA